MRKIFLSVATIALFSGVGAAQKKTVTNADLEKFRTKRVTAEAEYDRDAEKRGLPSREELAKRERERQIWLSNFAANARQKAAASAADLRAEAAAINANLAAVNAEIVYLRNLVGTSQPAAANVFYSFGYNSYGNYRGNVGVNKVLRGSQTIAQEFQAQTRANQQAASNVLNGNQTFSSTPSGNFGYLPFGANFPIVLTNGNYERSELILRLRALEQTRAGLVARFELLQDQARRDGVTID